MKKVIITGASSGIGEAIAMAVKRLRNRPQQSRVLILLTDGQNTTGEISPTQATELAVAENIRIHTIGIGADQMTINSFFGNRTVNPSADLDEETLRSISESTGGLYFRAKNTDQLRQIYLNLDQLEPIAQEAEIFRPKTELYNWFLGFTLLISILIIFVKYFNINGLRKFINPQQDTVER